MTNEQIEIASRNCEELSLDELMQVVGGGENSKAAGYFVGNLIGAGFGVLEKFGEKIAKVLA